MRMMRDSGKAGDALPQIEGLVVVVIDGHGQTGPSARPNSLVISFQASSIASGLK